MDIGYLNMNPGKNHFGFDGIVDMKLKIAQSGCNISI